MIACGFLSAQPQTISYQAVARNEQGHPLVNKNVSFRFSLLQGSASGAAVYVETHAITTNDFGLANLGIGAGTVSAGNFSTIDWGAAGYWLKVELDPEGGTTYSEMGTSQLLSVPYALYAKTAGVDGSETKINAGTNVTVTGSGTVASPYVISASEPTYTVGENTALGGYVFYVTPDGKHGLVAATKDQSSGSTWYAAHDSIGNPDKYDAAGKNFVDWRFPTKRELDLMYDQRVAIGNFDLAVKADPNEEPYYWSGTPASIASTPSIASRKFSTGFMSNLDPSVTSMFFKPRVRAVRSF